jgi:hypothetical protein
VIKQFKSVIKPWRNEKLSRAGSLTSSQQALLSAETERDAFKAQRDQAYGEVDDLCRERVELKGQLERVRRQER